MICSSWFSHRSRLFVSTLLNSLFFLQECLCQELAVLQLRWLVLYLWMQVPIRLLAKLISPWENILSFWAPKHIFGIWSSWAIKKYIVIILFKGHCGLTSNCQLRFQFCQGDLENELAQYYKNSSQVFFLIQFQLGAWFKGEKWAQKA